MKSFDKNLFRRQTLLIDANVTSLRQALSLLGQIDERMFSSAPRLLAQHRVGGHLRHIIEFYECFLDGLESGHVDYDARKRDERVERDRAVAAERIRSIIQRLEKTPALRGDSILFARMEGAVSGESEDPYLVSSVARELQVLSSHTIHHFALIAVTLRLHGVAVDPAFGVAPSTLRHYATKRLASSTEAA